MSPDEFVKYLKSLAGENGSQGALAEKLKISPAYLNDVLHGRREPGRKICEPLGFERVIRYVLRK